MDEATRQRCLEPFFSTKAQRGGTGLGLPMVYGMMQRHEGTIQIESALEQGTCIRLVFPVRQAPEPAAPSPLPVGNLNRSLSVLCIDDEPLIGELLRDSLGTLEHRVTIATGGRQGLDLFRSALRNQQPFEIVITDLGMPDVDGHQVARSIKAESPKTPVIMLTGWGATMKAEGEITPSIDALVGKPPRIQELNHLLSQLTVTNSR
jgi:CheY-like chemotaxis protein